MSYDQIPQQHVFHKYNFQIFPLQRQLRETPSRFVHNCLYLNRQAPRTYPNASHRKANSLCSSNKLNTGVIKSTVSTSLNTFQCNSSSHLKCVSALRLLKTAVISEGCVKIVDQSLPSLEVAALPVREDQYTVHFWK